MYKHGTTPLGGVKVSNRVGSHVTEVVVTFYFIPKGESVCCHLVAVSVFLIDLFN